MFESGFQIRGVRIQPVIGMFSVFQITVLCKISIQGCWAFHYHKSAFLILFCQFHQFYDD